MKKILFMLLVMCSAFQIKAQSCFTGTTTNPAVACVNAVLNATVDTLNMTMSGSYNATMSIQTLLTKTSGTIAGTVRLYGSNWGTTGTWDAVSDTATLANQAANTHTWNITQPAYKFYRILQSGGTTMAGTLGAKVVGLKP